MGSDLLKKKKMNKRDKFVLLSMFMLTSYCIAVYIASCFDKMIPDSLTVAWFAAWTVELALLWGIKIKDKGE